MPRTIRIGTRSSKLALIQASTAAGLIEPATSSDTRLIEIATSGDSGKDTLGDGVFVKEIQKALLVGSCDIAVHSLKDLPTETVDGLTLVAVLERADPRDCLVGSSLANLAKGSTVGTGSPRRAAQMKKLRPDVAIKAVRGNVPTRAKLIGDGEFHAVILARAGLDRLGMSSDHDFALDEMIGAAGQGAIVLECRNDEPTLALIQALDHTESRIEVMSERAVLARMGGGCLLPLGVIGRVKGDTLTLRARAVSPDGASSVELHVDGQSRDWIDLSEWLAAEMVKEGALDVMEES